MHIYNVKQIHIDTEMRIDIWQINVQAFRHTCVWTVTGISIEKHTLIEKIERISHGSIKQSDADTKILVIWRRKRNKQTYAHAYMVNRYST